MSGHGERVTFVSSLESRYDISVDMVPRVASEASHLGLTHPRALTCLVVAWILCVLLMV
jgi:hypothetical protein